MALMRWKIHAILTRVMSKKEFGKKITFMGGIGIDYLLSDQSKDEEIDKAVRDYIQLMAPGGRFIIGPTHSETSIPAG